MHRQRIIAQIYLILSILNLVLATPIVVQEIHEARGNEMVVAEDVPAMPKKSDGSMSLLSFPDSMTSPQHSSSSLSEGSTSSGHTQHVSSDSEVSSTGYLWMLDRLPRPSLDPHLPASKIGRASCRERVLRLV